MRRLMAIAALAAAACMALPAAPSAAISYEFKFDEVPAGTAANTLSQPPGLGVSFFNAEFVPEVDSEGDVIPGSEHWTIDPLAPPVLVEDPNNFFYGNAPSPLNALEAVFQPVLVQFDIPFNFDPAGFRTVLDLTPFGLNGTLPGFEDVAVKCYGTGGDLLGTIPVDQTTPGLGGGLQAVQFALLPSGAFYDNLLISGEPVPEPASLVVLACLAMALLPRRR